MEKEYDLVIIGGGCAGYPAAIYASRFNLKTLVIAKEMGGLITTTHLVENYPGFISLSGPELASKLEEHVKANNVEILNDIVNSVEKLKNGKFVIKTDINEYEIESKAIVLATGTKHRHLDAPGEKEFSSKGVSYCATCDGNFFRNKEVVIVGGSDSAAKEAMVLSQVCSKVTMLVRSKLKAEPINIERIKKIENVEILEGVQIKEIKGDKKVNSVLLDNGDEMQVSGVFIAVGMLPQNEIAKSLGVELNKKGEVIIDKLSTTNVKGVFAAGDLTDAPWKQGIVAAAEGSIAGYSAFEYINSKFGDDN